MKQTLFASRLVLPAQPDSPALAPASSDAARQSAPLLQRIKAIRIRHSACGVSSLLVRQGDRLLGVLEGAQVYVDRMMAALAQDGLLEDLRLLDDRPIRDREYSQMALSLVEIDNLQPLPAWAKPGLADIDLRTARRALKGLRAFHGLHAEPVRSSHLYTVEAGLGNR